MAQSGGFRVVDSGDGYDDLQSKQERGAGGSAAGADNRATLKAAGYPPTLPFPHFVGPVA